MANYREDFADVELQTGKICRNFMNQTIGSGDALGDRFGVHVFRDGEPVTLGGSCAGYFVRNATGETIVISGGVVSGNEAYVTLPAACYAVEGSFTLAIKVTSGDEVVTLRIVDGMVDRTNTSVIVDPGNLVPSIEDLIDAIDAAVASIPADYSSLWTSLAPAFSTSTNYTAGQYVTYNGAVYQFTVDHPAGTWNSAHVTATNLGGELSSLKSAFIKGLTQGTIGGWESGIFTPQGANYPSANYIRNQQKVGIGTSVPLVTVASNYKMRVFAWNGETCVGTLQTDGTFRTDRTDYALVNEFDCASFPNYLFKFAVRREPESSDITTSEGENVKFHYYTDKTLTQENKAADAKYVREYVSEEIDIVKEGIEQAIDLEVQSSEEITPSIGDNMGFYPSGGGYILANIQGYKIKYIKVIKDKTYKITSDSENAYKVRCGFITSFQDGVIHDYTTIENGSFAYITDSDSSYRYLVISYKIDSSVLAYTVNKIILTSEFIDDRSNTITFENDKGLIGEPTSANLGDILDVSGYSVSDLIDVENCDIIKSSVIQFTSSSASIGYAFYDKYNNAITGGVLRNASEKLNAVIEITVPLTAKYFRTTIATDTETYGSFVFVGYGKIPKIIPDINENINALKDNQYNERIIRVAAYNASPSDKELADYICDGVNDEVEIQSALNRIGFAKTGVVELSAGTFNLDEFKAQNNKYMIFDVAYQTALGTSKTIKGASSKAPSAKGGSTIIYVTSNALQSLGNNVGYVFTTRTFQYGMTACYKDFRLYMADNQHKVTVIDNSVFSAGECEDIRLHAVMPDVANTENTPMPVEECVGITGYCGDDSGVLNIMRKVFCTGFYEGFRLGGEHLICEQLGARYNYYSYTFGNYDWRIGTQSHPLTLINCCDEHAACLPRFVRCGNYNEQEQLAKQEINFISFNIELAKPANFGPGVTEPAVEEIPGAFCGRVDFTAYGYGNDPNYPQILTPGTTNSPYVRFWEDGSGEYFITRNMTHPLKGTSAERNFLPMFMQQYYDTTLNKMLVFNGTAWVDMMGNVVSQSDR